MVNKDGNRVFFSGGYSRFLGNWLWCDLPDRTTEAIPKRGTMNCSSIMGAPIALLLVAFPLNRAAAQDHHRDRHHVATHRPSFRHAGTCTFTNDGRRRCGRSYRRVRRAPSLDANGNRAAPVYQDTSIGGRPAGCPHAYCGCGLRKYLGLADKRLNLASNWARLFPHEATPRAELAAVRNHHVMYIEASAGDGLWLIRDYNSGGGLSRVHVRDVRGYVFVNPHARMASR